MAYSSLDCRQSGLLAVLVTAAALLSLQPAYAASEKCATTEWKVSTEESTQSDSGNWSIEDLKASQCSTLLQASRAETSNRDGAFKNGTWKLSGKVHLEFDGAVLGSDAATVVLDTDAATVVLVNGRISSVNAGTGKTLSPQAKKAVHVEFSGVVLDADTAAATFTAGRMKTIQALGAPAQFSFLKKSGQRAHGRSPRIVYDADKTLISFVDAWYSSGTEEGDAQMLTYNFTNGFTTTRKASATHDSSKLVPAPRTPDRATAK
jgi:lipopolysaccharide export system protein LptA